MKQLNLNDVSLDGEDEVDGGVGEETEEEEEIDLRAGLSMVQRKDLTVDGRNQKDIGKSNHGDNLEEEEATRRKLARSKVKNLEMSLQVSLHWQSVT